MLHENDAFIEMYMKKYKRKYKQPSIIIQNKITRGFFLPTGPEYYDYDFKG